MHSPQRLWAGSQSKHISSCINSLHLQHAAHGSLGFGPVGGVIMDDIWVPISMSPKSRRRKVFLNRVRSWPSVADIVVRMVIVLRRNRIKGL
jgi:hypothetical protein